MQHIFVRVADSLSTIIYNASIWTKNSCRCAVNDYHILYSFLVLLQMLFKQNGLTCVLRRAKVWMCHSVMCTLPTLFIFVAWMCHNVMCTLPTLFIFVARYLYQYSDWTMCWLMAEMGFIYWWRKDFSCQHCVHPAFCPGISGAFIFLRS
jgi:hypothetical protein